MPNCFNNVPKSSPGGVFHSMFQLAQSSLELDNPLLYQMNCCQDLTQHISSLIIEDVRQALVPSASLTASPQNSPLPHLPSLLPSSLYTFLPLSVMPIYNIAVIEVKMGGLKLVNLHVIEIERDTLYSHSFCLTT